MRQWMVPVEIMCKNHLLGEHVEHHMFRGHLNQNKQVAKYISNNCLEPMSLHQRHEEIANEINRRHKIGEFKNSKGHQSPLLEININHLSIAHKNYKIDKIKNLNELITRCPECRKRFERLCKLQPQAVVISL